MISCIKDKPRHHSAEGMKSEYERILQCNKIYYDARCIMKEPE